MSGPFLSVQDVENSQTTRQCNISCFSSEKWKEKYFDTEDGQKEKKNITVNIQTRESTKTISNQLKVKSIYISKMNLL